MLVAYRAPIQLCLFFHSAPSKLCYEWTEMNDKATWRYLNSIIQTQGLCCFWSLILQTSDWKIIIIAINYSNRVPNRSGKKVRSTFAFMHLADSFIQSDLQCIQAIHFSFISICVPRELNPQPCALLTQCSTTEPQEHQDLSLMLIRQRCARGGL